MSAPSPSTVRDALLVVLALVAGAALAAQRHRVPHVVASAGECRVEVGP